MERMTTLYILGNPDSLINTQYGRITYLQWLYKERQRIERDKTRIAEVFSNGPFYGLKVNAHPDCTCEFCKGERKK